jgi:hypothetical protein
MLRYVEALKTTPHQYLIHPNLTMLFEMLAAFDDPALSVLCKRQIMTSIEKIADSVPQKEALIRLLQ